MGASLLLAPLLGVLNLDGQSSSIVFDNNARLTTTCVSSGPPPPPLAPGITRMVPSSTVYTENGFVELRCSCMRSLTAARAPYFPAISSPPHLISADWPACAQAQGRAVFMCRCPPPAAMRPPV